MPQESNNERLDVARRLKETREYLGFSQDEVAKVVNIARPAISLIEKGERKVEVLELKKLAEFYNQSVSYFLGTEVPGVSEEVEFLARTANELTPEDQQELLQFAKFLKSKKSK